MSVLLIITGIYIIGCISAIITAKYTNNNINIFSIFYTNKTDIIPVFFLSWFSVIVFTLVLLFNKFIFNSYYYNKFIEWFEK